MEAATMRRTPSPGRRNHRTRSNTSASSIDDVTSLNSSFSGSTFKRAPHDPRTSSVGDHSVIRAAAGVSRMKYGRSRQKAAVLSSESGGIVTEIPSARGSRRSSVYSLSNLVDIGVKIRRRKRSTLDSWGRKRTPGETEYFDRHLPPIELFRRVVRLTQMIASLCLYKFEKENEEAVVPHTVFTQYINEEENQMQGELAFDASFFKANRKMRVAAEVKSTLLMPPEQRTEQQLAKVLFTLRSIRAFAEYPQRIQQKLVKVGWLETHQTKRAILRQGHVPQAFYFVLSGSAVVTVMEETDNFARTVHFLRRGDSFGELAIVHDTLRQANVISREAIELLVISREDFVDIFMLAGGIKNINDPDHKKFIRGIEFLKGWPLHLMASNAKKCMFHFFRSGSVLVKDSNHSDWIYIMKSGSCQVLKKLIDVKSRLIEHKDRVVGFENVKSMVPRAVSRSKLDRVRVKLSIVMLLLPKLKLKSPTLPTHNEDEDNLAEHKDEGSAIERVAAAQNVLTTLRSSSDLINRNRMRPEDDWDTVRSLSSDTRKRVGIVHNAPRVKFLSSQKRRPVSTRSDSSAHINKKNSDQAWTANTDYQEHRQRRLTPDSVNSSKNQRQLLPNIEQPLSPKAPCLSPVSSQGSTNLLRPQIDSSASTSTSRSSTVSRPGKRGRSKTRSVNLGDRDEEDAKIPRHKVSVIDEGALKENEVRITEADRHPAFVQVALLSKGDCFGIASMVFEDQPSLSLVSNGAECIMISKKFYLAHCTDAMKRRLLTTERPYPGDETLQRSLQDKVNWEAYKRKTMKDLVRAVPTARRREISLQNHQRSKRDMSLSQDLQDALKRMKKGPDDS